MKRIKSIFFFLFFISLFFSICYSCQAFKQSEYEIFVPSNLEEGSKYPLIVAFSPSGNGQGVLNLWKEIAEEKKCIIIASNRIKNGNDVQEDLEIINKDINTHFVNNFPIDIKKVVAVGMSGGGMAAHLYSFFYPNTVSAVITNVGTINAFSRSQSEAYTRNRICVFLASPTDFNYQIMKDVDLVFLQNHGWICKWIEFNGGHINAPADKLEEALDYALEQINEKEE